MLRTITVLFLSLVLLTLPACQMNQRLAGTLIGAGSGALVGGLATTSVVGVVVGGLAGGVAGYIVGDYLADQRERCQPSCDPCAPPACPPACPPTYAPTYAPQAHAEGGYQPMAQAATYRPTSTRNGGSSQAMVAQGQQAATTPEALAYYEEALRLDPRNAEAWYQIGLCRASAGDRAGGRAAFERALALDPGHGRARANLSWVGAR